ncbi:dolichyl-phosphate beta-glucosyltransferase isoform X3 [Sturnira hondurensis]|uniref:dolichyl-phosphate beta-glucosyltransferase isoform X3 n=1 Tax=Sturnira hondurensis TaxID=192404 RepID=UPI00187A3D8F|nr:dolichyl-phosphate beta-glucosyltransferase isoform X3 [Sturnira hondurensis]
MAPLSLQLAVLYAALGAALAAAALIVISFLAFITAREMPPLHRHEEEKFFLNARGRKEALPRFGDPPTKRLSVVVPSYNEEKRLPVMMDEALGYLEERQRRDPTFTYEVIVVDDGSKDQTSKVAFEYCRRLGSDKVRVITLVKNRGKGGAVKMGVFSSRGEKILMADADGATRFADVEKLEKALDGLQPWPVPSWSRSGAGCRWAGTCCSSACGTPPGPGGCGGPGRRISAGAAARRCVLALSVGIKIFQVRMNLCHCLPFDNVNELP